MTTYTYIGDGAWVAPLPARDLTDAEVEAFGEEAIQKTGLYKKAEEKNSPKRVNTKDGDA